MTSAQAGHVLQHLRRLTGTSPAAPLPDAQLLERFTARHDEAAFAALVRRHGPMVLNVCRSVLRHEQDAEDAFQATFLVLARKADSIRQPEAVAGWLCEVAYRAAIRAQADAARRRTREQRATPLATADPTLDMTLRDLCRVLHEELRRLPDRYRLPLVLCYLEGRSQEEAAAQLGWSKCTFRGRLDRGREHLRRQLAARGVALAPLLCATAVGPRATAEPLVESAVRSALGGAAPERAAALADGVMRATFAGKIKVVAAVLLAAGLVAGAAALTHQALAVREPPAASPPTEPPPAAEKGDRVEVTGHVLGPGGKPFAGARLYLRSAKLKEPAYPVRTTSAADGRFAFTFPRSLLDDSSPYSGWFDVIAVADGYGPDWEYRDKATPHADLTLRLVEDHPIRGRVIDLNGKPVPGATLRLEYLEAYADTEAFLQTVRDHKWPLVQNKGWGGPFPGQQPTLTTDADGRFRLEGVGRDRVVRFQLRGPGIRYGPVCVLARELKAPVEPRPLPYGPTIEPVHGATFEFVAAPARLVRGVVRDRKTGAPVAGAAIRAWGTTDTTLSDREGRYELRGVGKSAGGYGVSFTPDGRRYFSRNVIFPDTPGLGPVEGNVELVGGILVRGRVTNQATGQPIAGARVHYNPLLPNPFVRRFGPDGAGAVPCSATETGPDGTYRLVVLPGPGALGISASSPRAPFMPALVAARELKDFFKDNGNHGNEDLLRVQAGVNSMTAVGQAQYNEIVLLNPQETDTELTRDVALRPARPLRGQVVGPDGKPVTGVRAYKLAPGIFSQPLADDTFTVQGLNPRRPHHLLFLDQGRKLGAFVTLRGEVREPLVVRLEPCGSAAGRLVDEDGRPAAGVVVRLDPEGIDEGPDPVETDAEGRFRFAGLVPGQTYQARLGPGPFGQYLFSPFAVKSGKERELGVCRLKPKP